jgi:hypothetical protein
LGVGSWAAGRRQLGSGKPATLRLEDGGNTICCLGEATRRLHGRFPIRILGVIRGKFDVFFFL